jgi:hypothetical protein
MARQSSGVVQYKANLRRAIHHKLTCEAEKNQTTLNTEINQRLAQSFEANAIRSIEEVAANLVNAYRKSTA